MNTMANNIDMDHLSNWVGKRERREDIVCPTMVARMAGTLGLGDEPKHGRILPHPWHWLLFNPIPHAMTTARDGHPAKGEFMPPIPLPRRMWAGSEVECGRSLHVGEKVVQESRIDSVIAKSGTQGPLIFVKVVRDIYNGEAELALSEAQNIVYRAPSTGQEKPLPVHEEAETSQWQQEITPEPVMLFRFSALTFNGHRIHYDRDYAVNEEGYSGLVVHGPLIATLLLNLMYQKLGRVTLKRFSFRAVSPLFDVDPFMIHGCRDANKVSLWALTPKKQLAMSLVAEILEDKQ